MPPLQEATGHVSFEKPREGEKDCAYLFDEDKLAFGITVEVALTSESRSSHCWILHSQFAEMTK